jgi:endonuclease/exonuclease/phosphatase family metal-dependent hydrolase
VNFSILFWNAWFYNQIEGKARLDDLLNELKKLVHQHEPDIIALSEVVRPSQAEIAPVIKCLQELGYSYNHSAQMAQLDNYWMSGVALCSRFHLSRKQNIVISKNGYAAKRGHPGLNKEVISARVTLPYGHNLQVIVAHPSDTIHSLKSHRVGMKNLNQLAHSKTYSKNTLMVGDMNQWRSIPGSLRRKVADVMYSRTGTLLNPTWRHNAHRFTPLRLNLDYVYWSKQSDFSIKSFEVLSSDVSDHRPLLASFEQTVNT